MEKKENQEKKEIEGVRYDPEMNRYDDIILFPEKLAKAKEEIKNPKLLEFLEKMKQKEEVNK